MRKTILGLLLAFGAFAVTPAQAFDSDWRVKAGLMALEEDDSPAVNAGIVYAMDFIGIIGAEFEANTSITDGEYDFGAFGSADHSSTQIGGYATLTTPGPIYFKGKAGLAYNDIDIGGLSDSGANPAFGVGLGLFGFEIEYTRSQVEWQGEDIDMDYLSVAFGF